MRGAKPGRLIRHTRQHAAAVGTLAIPMVKPTFGTLLMAAVGFATLQSTGFFTAAGTAITLSPITVAAEIERRPAGREATHALTEN
ncbi:MAG TPA: hypothetical protein VKD24_07075 [Candidatus Angelobacter sp.]|nr:hypothetical protein [Candidatus Angelobacter sp.]